MRICIRGVVYESADDAAKAHGVQVGRIWQALTYGTIDSVGLRGKHPQKTRKAVRIGSLRFQSIGEASRAIGVSRETIRRAMAGDISEDTLRKAMIYAKSKPPE